MSVTPHKPTSTIANGHRACPTSRRGHTWRELAIPPSAGAATIRDLVESRVCARCGAVGRVSKQGIVVATGDRIDAHDVQFLNHKVEPRIL